MYAIYELTNPERVVRVVEYIDDIDTNVYGCILVPADIEQYSPYFSIADGDLYYSPETEKMMRNVRVIRNSLLEDSDWTQLSDVQLSAGELAEWKQYRQDLRDWPGVYVPGDKWWETVPLKPGVTRIEYISQEQFSL